MSNTHDALSVDEAGMSEIIARAKDGDTILVPAENLEEIGRRKMRTVEPGKQIWFEVGDSVISREALRVPQSAAERPAEDDLWVAP